MPEIIIHDRGNGMFDGTLDGREFGIILTRTGSDQCRAAGYIYDMPWDTATGRNYMQSLDADQIHHVVVAMFATSCDVVKTNDYENSNSHYVTIPAILERLERSVYHVRN